MVTTNAGLETEAALSAKKLLAEAVTNVLETKNDPALADKYRRKIVEKLLELAAER